MSELWARTNGRAGILPELRTVDQAAIEETAVGDISRPNDDRPRDGRIVHSGPWRRWTDTILWSDRGRLRFDCAVGGRVCPAGLLVSPVTGSRR